MTPKPARFVISASQPAGFPDPTLPEIAFAGRSNVGKSSLINRLTGVAKLARTSNTPGRTRLINWFHVTPRAGAPLHFVDLPGYGYAKVSRSERESWRPLIEAYLGDRPPLRALVLLIDARRGAESEELELIDWLRDTDVRTIAVVTKIDKLAKNRRKPVGFAQQKVLSSPRPPLLVSAHTGDGIDQLWHAIRTAAGSRPQASKTHKTPKLAKTSKKPKRPKHRT